MRLIEDQGPSLTENEDGTRDFQMLVRCSSGTYVRTLAHDIGERLGVGAHLARLRRTEVGRFRIAEALTLDQLEMMTRDDLRNALMSTSEMVSHLPVIWLDERRIGLVANGRAFPLAEDELAQPGVPLRLCDREGELVAVGEYDERIKLVRPRVVMRVGDA